MIDTSAHVVAPGEVLFRLTESALIAANSGAAFTREGVIAVCYSCLSPKSDNRPDDNYRESGALCANARLPALIRKELEEMPVNARKMHAGTERQTAKDYQGRFELELIQNADDADGVRTASELIGAKGMGFKSVLEITDTPEIHSGDFHFQLETVNGLRVPVVRPPSAAGDPKFATMIRLPFRGQTAKEAALKAIDGIRPETLLFCQRLSRIIIQIRDKESRVFEIVRRGVFGFGGTVAGESAATDFTLKETGRTPREWRRWSAVWTPENGDAGKRLSVALCLPLENGKEKPYESGRPVHVFMPTVEKIPDLGALVHASYDPDISRKNLLEGQSHGDAIRHKISEMAGIVMETIPADTALRAFGKIPQTDGQSELGKLQNIFASAVADTTFVPVIGGPRVKPSEARLWEHGLGNVLRDDCDEIRRERLLDPDLEREKECKSILRGLKAKRVESLSEHARLLRFCKTDDAKQCAEAFGVAAKIAGQDSESSEVADTLKHAPFWRTVNRNSPVRALVGELPLLWRHPGRKDWPAWFPVDSLSPEFTDMLSAEDCEAMEAAMKNDWPLNNERRYFDAMVKFCGQPERRESSKWWSEKGWSVLRWARKWLGEINESERMDASNGKILRLPTNRGWLPAADCYAGPEWGGPECFVNIESFGVVRVQEKAEWEKLFAWLGLSRTPKLRRNDNGVYQFDKRALDALKRESDLKKVLEIVCEMAALASDKSSALFQLKGADLIPCKPDIFRPECKWAKPGNVYMPGRGKGCFPEVAVGDLDDAMRGSLSRLGVNEKLPPSENKEWWRGCMRDLAEEAKRRGESSGDLLRGKGEFAEVVRELYKEYNASLSDMGDVPYLRQASNGDLFVNFAPFAEVVWLDKKHHKDPAVYRDILGEFRVFPLELENGRHFELRGLSGDMEWLHRLAGKMHPDRLRWDKGREGDVAKFIRTLYGGKDASERPQCNAYAPFLQRDGEAVCVGFAPAHEVRRADKPYHEETKVRDALLREGFKIFPFFLSAGEWSGLKPLSSEMSEHPVPGVLDDSATKELRRRFFDRRKVFEVLLRRVCGISSGAPSQSIIQGCSSLNLVLKDHDEREIVQSRIDASVHNAEILVNVGNSRWRALADGLTQWWNVRPYSADFEGILRDKKSEDWIHRLRKWGISEEDLSSLEEQSAQPIETPPDSTLTVAPSTRAGESIPASMPTSASPAISLSDSASATAQLESSAVRPPTRIPDEEQKSAKVDSVRLPQARMPPPAISSPTPAPDSGRGKDGGESPKHQDLKQRILENPGKLGISELADRVKEGKLADGGKVDVLFKSDAEWVAVEVKSEISQPQDVERGLFQCVKYEALMEAEIRVRGLSVGARAILAVGGQFPRELEDKRKILGVNVYEIQGDAGNAD